MSDEQTKIDRQRDVIDNKNTEIQRLHDRMELLDQSDVRNFEQHKQIMEKMDGITATLTPICETYTTVGRMAKWIMAFLVFLSVLGGVIVAWGKIFSKE
jgi:hypothetical protein